MKKIICVGDSISEGHNGWDNDQATYAGDDPVDSQYEYHLFKLLSNGLEPTATRIQVADGEWITRLEHTSAWYTVYNAGHGAHTIDQLISRLQYDVEPYTPDYVIVLAGVNDIGLGDTFDSIIASLTSIYDSIKSIGGTPIPATITPVNKWQPDGATPNAATVAKITQVNTWILGYAHANNYKVIDFYSIMEDPANSGHVRAEDNSDGVHFTVAGYTRMGSNIPLDVFVETKNILYLKTPYMTIELPLNNDGDIGIGTEEGTKYLRLVDEDAPNASDLRIKTDVGIKAIAK